MANKKQLVLKETEEYHNTYLLLKKYRDAVWSLELSVQKIKNKFLIEMGSSIEDFLETVYLAGTNFADSGLIEYTKNIEQSRKMLRVMESALRKCRFVSDMLQNQKTSLL